jgi:hypothetical protein
MSSVHRPKTIVIVDLDGTLALDEHRAHHLDKKPRDWDTYFSLCSLDEPNYVIIQLVRTLKLCGKQIYILTGRIDRYKRDTEVWLDAHQVPYDHLMMRPADCRTEDFELKIGWLDDLGIRDRVWMVLEDRKRVVDAWRRQGLKCLQVADGNF